MIILGKNMIQFIEYISVGVCCCCCWDGLDGLDVEESDERPEFKLISSDTADDGKSIAFY